MHIYLAIQICNLQFLKSFKKYAEIFTSAKKSFVYPVFLQLQYIAKLK